MQRKSNTAKSNGRPPKSAEEMCRARLPGQDRRVQRKRLESAQVRDRVRNPQRRSGTDY